MTSWEPSALARAVGERLAGLQPYVRGETMSPGDDRVQLDVGAGTAVLASWLRSRYSLESVGTRRAASLSSPARRADGSYRRRDQHEEGRALDAMTGDERTGDEIANLMVSYARELGVQYVIWRDTEWCPSLLGPAFEPARSSADRAAWGRSYNGHRDHVHVELLPAHAASAEAMRTAIAAIESGATPAGATSPIAGDEGRTPGSLPVVAGVALGIVAAIVLRRRRK